MINKITISVSSAYRTVEMVFEGEDLELASEVFDFYESFAGDLFDEEDEDAIPD